MFREARQVHPIIQLPINNKAEHVQREHHRRTYVARSTLAISGFSRFHARRGGHQLPGAFQVWASEPKDRPWCFMLGDIVPRIGRPYATIVPITQWPMLHRINYVHRHISLNCISLQSTDCQRSDASSRKQLDASPTNKACCTQTMCTFRAKYVHSSV